MRAARTRTLGIPDLRLSTNSSTHDLFLLRGEPLFGRDVAPVRGAPSPELEETGGDDVGLSGMVMTGLNRLEDRSARDSLSLAVLTARLLLSRLSLAGSQLAFFT